MGAETKRQPQKGTKPTKQMARDAQRITFLENGLPQPVCAKWFAANHFTRRVTRGTETERQTERYV